MSGTDIQRTGSLAIRARLEARTAGRMEHVSHEQYRA